YLLGGWSFGGLIAFEMARQLTRQGEEVPRVLLLDTRVPAISEAMSRLSPELLRAFLLIDEARGVTLAAGQEQIPLTPRDIVHLDLDAQLDLLLNELWRREAFPPDVDREMLRRFFEVRMARIDAMNRYVPETWEGRLVLFRTGEVNPEIPLEEIREIYRDASANHPSDGWSALARELEIEPVPGHHESMVQSPHVLSLAEALRRHVDLYVRETSASLRQG
ncbi:MAG TPA: thioesterase domain-containing protein, partial [Rubrobacter sp.]|nr:thioesterase domain-containing protein [Rubrobacter sp.]